MGLKQPGVSTILSTSVALERSKIATFFYPPLV